MRRLSGLILAIAVLSACGGQPTTDNTRPTTADEDRSPTADFGRYGPYRLGMTVEEVRTAAKGEIIEPPMIGGAQGRPGPCRSFIDSDANAQPASRLSVLLLRDAGYRVVGITVPQHARTTTGIGYGSNPTEIRNTYSGKEIQETTSQGGKEILVKSDVPDSFLGFSVSPDGNSIISLRVGTHDYAAAYELCSGG